MLNEIIYYEYNKNVILNLTYDAVFGEITNY
jgi:hypothetical protein